VLCTFTGSIHHPELITGQGKGKIHITEAACRGFGGEELVLIPCLPTTLTPGQHGKGEAKRLLSRSPPEKSTLLGHEEAAWAGERGSKASPRILTPNGYQKHGKITSP